jgi:hypothetical protein
VPDGFGGWKQPTTRWGPQPVTAPVVVVPPPAPSLTQVQEKAVSETALNAVLRAQNLQHEKEQEALEAKLRKEYEAKLATLTMPPPPKPLYKPPPPPPPKPPKPLNMGFPAQLGNSPSAKPARPRMPRWSNGECKSYRSLPAPDPPPRVVSSSSQPVASHGALADAMKEYLDTDSDDEKQHEKTHVTVAVVGGEEGEIADVPTDVKYSRWATEEE